MFFLAGLLAWHHNEHNRRKAVRSMPSWQLRGLFASDHVQSVSSWFSDQQSGPRAVFFVSSVNVSAKLRTGRLFALFTGFDEFARSSELRFLPGMLGVVLLLLMFSSARILCIKRHAAVLRVSSMQRLLPLVDMLQAGTHGLNGINPASPSCVDCEVRLPFGVAH